MFIRFITSRLLRVIVCAALVWLFLKGTKKLREKIAVG